MGAALDNSGLRPRGWAGSMPRWPSRVKESIAAKADRWILWAPVSMGCGAAVYLGLKDEPSLLWSLAPLVLAVVAAVLARRLVPSRLVSILTLLLAFAAFGFACGKLRSESVAGPIAPATGAVPITGWVVDVASPGESGGRLIIAPTHIGSLTPEQIPARIRVTSRDNLIGPGGAVRFTGLINPPPPPASPGGYDFARNAWFDRIGGVGVALTPPQIISLGKPPWLLDLQMRVNAMRWGLAVRIAADMSPRARGLGVAMITGHEAFIDPDTEQTLRDAGLAHIISISGVHMAIVGGFAFLLVRLFIAAIPWLALRVPGKKVAACFGLAAVGTYLVVSGAPAPAVRAAITAAVAFLAILADRQAISLRSLAIAALVVLTLQPEAVGEAGFQMSFSATAALVALFEVWRRAPREINTPWPIRIVQGALTWLGLSLTASFVAGLATGPFSIQHFNRVAVFGLPANLAVEPLASFIMMPSLALGAALEPIGLGKPFLDVASASIEALQGGAAWTAKQPHAVMLIASASQIALPIAFLGVLWLCLWKGKGRWLGLPAALAISLWPRSDAPVAWIDAEGSQAAVRMGREAVVMRVEDRRFGAEFWSKHRGLTLAEDNAGAFDCTGSSCRAAYTGHPRLSLWWTRRIPAAETLDALCQSSDILVIRAAVDAPESCRGVRVLRAEDFARGGSAEIMADGRMVWAQPLRGGRPWTLNDSGG